MAEKFKVKVGEDVKIITGKHQNSSFVVKGINRKKNIVFLEHVSRVLSVVNKKGGKRQAREVFSSVHISNVKATKQQ